MSVAHQVIPNHAVLESLAMTLAKSLPVQVISEFKKAHVHGINLETLADAALLARARQLSTCGRSPRKL